MCFEMSNRTSVRHDCLCSAFGQPKIHTKKIILIPTSELPNDSCGTLAELQAVNEHVYSQEIKIQRPYKQIQKNTQEMYTE